MFDNGVGRVALALEEQAELTKRTGYAGIFYSGTKDIPQPLAAHIRGRPLHAVMGVLGQCDLERDVAVKHLTMVNS